MNENIFQPTIWTVISKTDRRLTRAGEKIERAFFVGLIYLVQSLRSWCALAVFQHQLKHPDFVYLEE